MYVKQICAVSFHFTADASLTQMDRNFLIGGVCALLLGAVFLAVGLIQYKRKTCDPQFSNPL